MNPYLRIPRFVAIAGFVLGLAGAYWLTLPAPIAPVRAAHEPPKIRRKIHVPEGAKFRSNAPDRSWFTIADAGGVILVNVNGRRCFFEPQAKCDYERGDWDDTVKAVQHFDVFADDGDTIEFRFRDYTEYTNEEWTILKDTVQPTSFSRWKSEHDITVDEVR